METVSIVGHSFTMAENTYVVVSGGVIVEYIVGDFTNNGTISDTKAH